MYHKEPIQIDTAKSQFLNLRLTNIAKNRIERLKNETIRNPGIKISLRNDYITRLTECNINRHANMEGRKISCIPTPRQRTTSNQ